MAKSCMDLRKNSHKFLDNYKKLYKRCTKVAQKLQEILQRIHAKRTRCLCV